MKIKKILLVLLLFLVSMAPIQAKTKKGIMIFSKQLPYVIYAQVKDEQHMNVHFIPNEMRLPMVCELDEVVPIQHSNVYKKRDCVQTSIERFFDIEADNYVYIHLDTIADTLDLPYKNKDFTKIGTITDYFAEVVKKLKPSMILHYGDYIESDLGVSDYYDYYKMFKGKKVSIDYSFVNLVYSENEAIPLDNTFYTSKAK